MNATYTKLNSGEWGVRVEGARPSVGDVLDVRKRSGETKQERVAGIVWEGNGVVLCTISAAAKRRGGRDYSDGCDCSDGCCSRGCHCSYDCNCRGGPIYDC